MYLLSLDDNFLTRIIIIVCLLVAESWIRHPIGVISGNRFQLGIYDECVKVQYPVRAQYCVSEVKLSPPTGKDYSYKRTDDLDDFGNKHAWNTILGVPIYF